MPTNYKPEAIQQLLTQFQEYDAPSFGVDASSIKSRLKVCLERGLTGPEMITEAKTTVGINNPGFAKQFESAVRRLSIP